MSGVLRDMLKRAFDADGQPIREKTAAAPAPGSVDSGLMLKLAQSLEGLASAIEQQVGTGIMGGDFATRSTSDESGTALEAGDIGQGAFGSPPGWQGSIPSGMREPDILGGDQPPSNQFGIVTASLRKNASQRASDAMKRVLGRIKAASMRRVAAEDPALPGNLGGDSSTGDPSSMPPTGSASEVPQSISAIMDLTNDEAAAANTPDETAILGGGATQAASASDVAGQILEHASGDEEPIAKAAHAAILRTAVLSEIARGG